MMAKVASGKKIPMEQHRPMPPLPPTPPLEEYDKFEIQAASLPCGDEEDPYDEPDKLMQDVEHTNSASTLLTQPVSTHAHKARSREIEWDAEGNGGYVGEKYTHAWTLCKVH